MDTLLDLIVDPAYILGSATSIALFFFQPIFEKARTYLFNAIVNSSKTLRKAIRRSMVRGAIEVKNTRRNEPKIIHHIARENALFLLFMTCIGLYLTLITFPQMSWFLKLPGQVQLFIAAPIYIFEALWLLQQSKTKEFINARGKIISKSLRSTHRWNF